MPNRLAAKLHEQQLVYELLKEGETSTVCYREFQNGSWGTDDANYTNRLRLAYYLLYYKIDDEEAIAYLFQEELKDRERNSFQGIGSTLSILTYLLKKYNTDQQYTELFQRAKHANFDCACGYDTEGVIDEELEHHTLLDCIYLAEEMQFLDVMGELVDDWKAGITEWNSSDRDSLIRFNQVLGREEENEGFYLERLEKVLEDNRNELRTVISGYRDLIKHYLNTDCYEQAHHYCKELLETTDYTQIKRIRLFGDILEVCLEVAAKLPADSGDLWCWAKTELQSGYRPGWWYGNLYQKGIIAAKAMEDSYAEELEKEYVQWKKELGIN